MKLTKHQIFLILTYLFIFCGLVSISNKGAFLIWFGLAGITYSITLLLSHE